MPNPGVTTLGTVTLQAQQRADMVSSSFLSASEWTSNINASYQELYGLLVQKFGNDYFCTFGTTFTTDGTNYLYSLPTDFFKLLGVDQKVSNKWVTLRPFTFAERNRYSATSAIPVANITLRILYVPRLTLLVNSGDTLDGVDGWEEYIVCDAAIKALQKEESDVSVLMAQKRDLAARIEAEAENRDAGFPATVSDSQSANAEWPLFYSGQNLRYRLNGNSLWLAPDDSSVFGHGGQ